MNGCTFFACKLEFFIFAPCVAPFFIFLLFSLVPSTDRILLFVLWLRGRFLCFGKLILLELYFDFQVVYIIRVFIGTNAPMVGCIEFADKA